MFIGHYGVSLAIKKARPEIPTWLLYLGVQWIDILFCIFVFLGIEKLRIVPGFTAVNPFDLYFMPYTHSLLGALFWSVVFGGTCAFIVQRIKSTSLRVLAFWLGFSVFSHFLLDLPMHDSDLQLAPGSDIKFGFGLWNYLYPTLIFETLVFLGGVAFFKPKLTYRFWIWFVLSLFLLLSGPFMPPPENVEAFGVSALIAYVVLAILAQWSLEAQSISKKKLKKSA